MRYTLILLLFLTSCATFDKGSNQIATPEDVARIVVKPKLDLPQPLELDKYKIDTSKVKQYKDGDQLYIAIPEQDVQHQQEFLLILKTRILELQRIIIDAQKLI
jgi:hypothetical protein